MIFSVAYQKRKSMSIIERVIYIYIYQVIGIIYSRSLLLFIEIYRVGDNRTVNTSTSPHNSDQLGTENVWETLLCWFIVMLRVLVCKNMYRYERHLLSLPPGTLHCSCFRLCNRTYQSWQLERQRHHRWNAYLTSMFGHYIGGYIIN